MIEDLDFDVIGVTETWLSDSFPSKHINIPNYSVIRMDRVTRGGGVCMYIRSSYSFRQFYASTDNNIEQLWINVNCKHKKLAIGIAYKPST